MLKINQHSKTNEKKCPRYSETLYSIENTSGSGRNNGVALIPGYKIIQNLKWDIEIVVL